MSRYDVARGRGTAEPGDDAAARIGFTSRRRTDFDIDGALTAARRTPPRLRRRPGGGLEAAPSGRANLWLPLGPTDMFAPPGDNRQRNAGRIKMLDVDSTGTRVYAVSGNGGVWYSGDGGATWASIGGFAATTVGEIDRPAQRHASGAIFVDFKADVATDIVYVGTGEPSHTPSAQPGRSLGGIGVLVATGPANAVATANPWTREAKDLLGFGCSRFAKQPSGDTIVVATTTGLFQRPAVGGADAVWTRVAGDPFDDLTNDCTDVLWTPANGTTPERLWVWVKGGGDGGLWVRDAGETDFTQVPTPTTNGRGVLAAPATPTQVFVFNDRGAGVIPRLFRVMSGAAHPVAADVTNIVGVPDMVGRQGFYDMSIAVHPTQPNHVVLAGNTFDHVNIHAQPIGSYGAIISGDIANVGAVATFTNPLTIGTGVHADVHYLRYSNAGATLWTTCDGGVYRNDHPDKVAGFVPRNNGLAVTESNYLVSHPNCEGYVVAGLQDNGVIERRSNGVWAETDVGGDGGGVAFDPLRPDRFIRQHSATQWSTSNGTLVWNHFPDLNEPTGAFYSTPASIGHRRGVVAPAKPNVGQVILGTRRVWYTEDFGTTWFTLPSGTPDPLLVPDLTVDDFGESITVCRWQHPDVAWILGEGKLERYTRSAASDAGGAPGTWGHAVVLAKSAKKNKKDATSAEGPIRDTGIWTDVAVNLEPDTNADGYGEMRGTLGALYLGTIGNKDNDEVDTLWWFNGTDTWFPTGLRAAVPAPVTAIVCDPAHPAEVFVGTTVGAWRGTRTLNGTTNPPTWTFEAINNGLPEAAIEDLVIFSDGGLRILRAAIAARGIWELRLDVTDVTDLTYVRAHDDDLRYRPRALETKRDLVTPRSWHGSPDVRPRRAPSDLPPPGSLPWTKSTANLPEALRRFQSILRAKTNDLRVRPDGKWDDYFNEVLRDLGAPTSGPPNHTVSITEAFWNSTLDGPLVNTEAWLTPVPTEADLFDLTAPLSEGSVGAVSCGLPAKASRVEVVVHHRGLDPMDGANVRVTLLRWRDPKTKKTAKFDDSTTWFSGPVPWTAAVNEVLNSAGGTFSNANAFANGWAFVGSNAATRRKTLTGQTLHNMRSGIATFDLDLTGLKANRVTLLVAVIRAGAGVANDSALAPATLQELALTSPHVAVRSLKIGT